MINTNPESDDRLWQSQHQTGNDLQEGQYLSPDMGQLEVPQ